MPAPPLKPSLGPLPLQGNANHATAVVISPGIERHAVDGKGRGGHHQQQRGDHHVPRDFLIAITAKTAVRPHSPVSELGWRAEPPALALNSCGCFLPDLTRFTTMRCGEARRKKAVSMHVKTAFCHHSGRSPALQETTIMILLSLISQPAARTVTKSRIS